MFNLKVPRLPYREDVLFSLLGFTIFLVPLAFSIFAEEDFEMTKFALFLVLTGACLLVFLKHRTSKRSAVKYSPVVFWLLASWLSLGLLSTVGSMDKLYSLFGFYYRFTSGFLFYVVFALFVFLLFQVIDEGRFIVLLKTLAFCCLLISIISCLQSLGVGYYAGLNAPGFIRPPGSLGNPDFTAMFLVACLPFVLFLFHKSRIFYGKLYYGLCGFFIIIANLVLASRGALLALAIGFIFAIVMFIIYRFQNKLVYGLLVAGFAVAIFGGAFLNVSRPQAISSLFVDSGSNLSLRLYAWEVSAIGIIRHPWLGSGPGTFSLAFEQNRPSTLPGSVGVFDDAHNLFLQMAESSGLPFTLIFFGLMAYAGYYGLRRFHQLKDPLVLSGLTALVIWAVAGCFTPVTIPQYLLLGLTLVGLLYTKTSVHSIDVKYWQKIAAGCLGSFLLLAGICLISGEYIFSFADTAYINGNYAEAFRLSDLAARVNPTSQLYYAYRAGSEIYLGKDQMAITRDIDKVGAMHPVQANSYVEDSNLYDLLFLKTGNKDYLRAAILNMREALAIDRYFPERYSQTALYYYQLGELPQAEQFLNYSLGQSEDNFDSWILLAKIYQLNNQRPALLFALEKAFQLNPDSRQVSYILQLAKSSSDIKTLPLDFFLPKPSLN